MTRKLQTLMEYIAILFLILDCYSLFSITGNNGENIKIIALVLFIIIFLFEVIRKRKIKITTNLLLFLCVYVLYQFFFGIINNTASIIQFIFNQLFIVVLFLLLFSLDNLNLKFWKRYRDIICIICAFSLFFFIFGTLLSIVKPSGIINAKWGPLYEYKNYFYLYNSAQGTWFFGNALARNIGIFAEGPMFSYCVCFGLWYEIFYGNYSKLRIVIMVSAIFTSFSVTGIIFIGIMIFVKYFELGQGNKNMLSSKRLFILSILLVSFVLGFFLLFDKLDSVSGVSRSTQYSRAWSIWKENPFFGLGYRQSVEGFSSGILLSMVECGLIGTALYFVPIVLGTIKAIKQHDFPYIALCLGFTVCLLFTVVPYKIVTLSIDSFIIFYIVNNKKLTPRINMRRKI